MKEIILRLLGRGQTSNECPFSVTSDEFVSDPYPSYARLRRDQPLAPLSGGGFLLTRHEDICSALVDPRLGNAPSRFSTLNPRHAERHLASSMAARMPPFLDMPGHRLPRQALTKAFFSTLDGYLPALDTIARRHAELAGRVDIIEASASPFACETMARFVGIDERPDTLRPLTSSFFQLFAPITDADAFAVVNRDLARGREIIQRSVQAQREQSGPNLLSHLLEYQKDNKELSDDHIADLAFLVTADGIENIQAGVALVLRWILSDESTHRRSLEAASIEPFVREALRLETPGQLIPRVARESFQLHGQMIPEGMPIFLALASANRDPSAFDRPEAFDERREGSSMTFGLGRHRCLGEPLAVAMIGALVSALLRRGISQSAFDRRLAFHPRFGHRWPTRSMVTVSHS